MSNRPKMSLVYYVNLFRGPGGEICQSPTPLNNIDDAAQDAYLHTETGFSYVSTLTNLPEDVTPEIARRIMREATHGRD